MPTCVAVGCSLRAGTNKLMKIKFHRFPKDGQQKDAWIRAIKRKQWTPSDHSRVCSTHFITGKPAAGYDINNPDWAPNQNLGSGGQKGKKKSKIKDDVPSVELPLELTEMPRKLGGGRVCAVVGCHNNYRKLRKWREAVCEEHEPSLHKDCPCLEPFGFRYFPVDDEKKRAWIAALKRKDFKPNRESVVCSFHFVEGRPTERNPVPQINMGYEKQNLLDDGSWRESQAIPTKNRKLDKELEVCLQEVNEPNDDAFIQPGDCSCACHTCFGSKSYQYTQCTETKATQTGSDVIYDHGNYAKPLPPFKDNQWQKASNSVGIQVNTSFDLAGSLGKQDCIFYTGLNLKVFITLVQAVTAIWTVNFKTSISNQVLLVLMRLRLGLTVTDLGKRFGISKATAAAIVCASIKLLAKNIGHLIMWLPRETIKELLPEDFKVLYGTQGLPAL